MAANTDMIFPLTPLLGQGLLSTANLNRDGTGSLVLCATAGDEGARVNFIHFHSTAESFTSLVTIFARQGSTYTLIGEVAVSPLVPSATSVGWSYDWFPALPVILPASAMIYCGTTVSQLIAVTVNAGSY